MKKQQSGFTLVELAVVILVLSILTSAAVLVQIKKLEERRLDVLVGEVEDLFSSAQLFTADNAGVWPDEANDCVGAVAILENPAQGYLVGFNPTNIYGGNYTTSCPDLGVAPRRFNISFDVGDAEIAQRITGNLKSATVAGTVVTTSAPLLTNIPALELLLPLDGTRAMTGDLDMGDNEILNARDVTVNGQELNGDPVLVSEGIFFAGIVPANNNVVYDKPICSQPGATSIPIVVPAGNSPTEGVTPTAYPMGGQYAWAEDAGAGWRFFYRVAIYKNNVWQNQLPNSAANFLAVYFKCS